jgi:hypothetical protein
VILFEHLIHLVDILFILVPQSIHLDLCFSP